MSNAPPRDPDDLYLRARAAITRPSRAPWRGNSGDRFRVPGRSPWGAVTGRRALKPERGTTGSSTASGPFIGPREGDGKRDLCVARAIPRKGYTVFVLYTDV